MALFTSLLVAGFLGVEATFFTAAVAFGLNLAVTAAASIGLSYAAKALSGQQDTASHFSAQGTLQASGDVPRSIQLGYSVTAGSLVYANTWGVGGKTPNANLTQVIALADEPAGSLVEVWVNGEKCTLGPIVDTNLGAPVIEYNKNGQDHLWIKYHDGTQTTADALLTGFVSSTDRPYNSTRVGLGVTYVVTTAIVEDTLFTGFPTFKFAVSGMPLYDISKDTTAGGSGSHRWSDKTTWGGDGDSLPAVQIYNLLRGIYYNGTWLYGLQNMSAARLPATNWIAQIAKCRATITGEDGDEPTYRSGGQINVNAQTANAVEAILTACQGRISEIGGFYKIHLGAPDSPVDALAFTDDDTLSSEEQTYRPFFALADSVNGIQGTYPDPSQGWNTATAPALYRADLEVKDGNRRLMANPAFDFVPYAAQVQRLQKSAIEEAQRARTHTIVLPPEFWIGEPGDIVEWTSERNGYTDKLFRIDGIVDKANLDVAVSLTEVDSSDYDWDHDVDFTPVTSGPTVFPRPAAQSLSSFAVSATSLLDSNGITRRPAIRLTWDGTQPGISGVQYQVRLQSSGTVIVTGRTDQYAAGSLIISEGLLPNTVYEVSAAIIPSSPRDVTWSSWLPVTTPDVRLSDTDLTDGIRYNITTLTQQFQQDFIDFDARVADALTEVAAQSQLNQKTQNQQSWDHRVDLISRIAVGDEANSASIDDVRTVANNAAGNLADYEVTVAATYKTITDTATDIAAAKSSAISTAGTNTASAISAYDITVSSTYQTISGSTGAIATAKSSAISTAESYADAAISTYNVTVSSTYKTISGTATDIATAKASAISTAATYSDGAIATYDTTVGSIFGSASARIHASETTITTLNGYAGAQYAVDLNVNGYATGFKLLNGGGGISSFVVVSDQFKIQKPGYNGSAPVSIFTTGTVNGTASIGITGNVFLDGTLYGTAIRTGSIDTTRLAVNSVDILNIIDGAATNTTSTTGTGTITTAVAVKGGRLVMMASVAETTVTATLRGTLSYDPVAGRSTTFTQLSDCTTFSPDNGVTTAAPSITLMGYVAGLADGTYTVKFVSSSGTGTVVAINPRR